MALAFKRPFKSIVSSPLGLATPPPPKLQLVHNSAPCMITWPPLLTSIIQQLHWLRITHRIHFKILLLTNKANHNLASFRSPSHCNAYQKTHILFLYLPQSIQPLCSSTMESTSPWSPQCCFIYVQFQPQNPLLQTRTACRTNCKGFFFSSYK